MRRANLLALMAGAALGLAVPAQAQAPSGPTAFEGGRIIVGDGRVIDNCTIVVEGSKITQAGPAAEVKVPVGANRVNLSGKTVMPDIIDTHTHLSQTKEAIERDLKRRAYYGVSAALSMGTNENESELDVRAHPQPGEAKLFTAWRGITRPEPGRTTAPFWVDNEDQARKAVQDLAAHKVDIVKVWIDDRDGKFPKMTPALYGAAIDEAHKNGLRATVHIFTLDDAKGALKAGVDAFAHSVRDRDVDDEFMALVKQHPNLVVNPNLPPRGVKTDVSWLKASLPAAEMERVEKANVDDPKAQAFYGIQSRNLAKLNAAGVKIILGTDGNTPWGPHEEIADMVTAGMTPAQAITAATKNGAEFLKMTDAGTLQAGKNADFIVLDANPLDDITNTRKISAVYLQGAPVDRGKPPQ
jgi:imidazolonepropionase-like amidohydrolase